jgi:DNA-binding transcriptional ArsR family regulator
MAPNHLSSTLAALSDSTRRGIVGRLATGQATITKLAGYFCDEPAAASRHVTAKEHAGLIARRREAQWRPCRVTAAPLQDIAG